LNVSDPRKNSQIEIQDLCFYFDGQAKDRFDQGELGKKNSLVLALREKLLAMPTDEFDSTIRSIEKLVSGVSPQKADDKEKRKGARELYERTAEEIRKA
jgi:hypothetical protein